MTTPPPGNPDKHFSVRTALVLLFSLLIAIGAGLLFHAGTHSTALAILTGGAAFGGAWTFLDRILH